MSIIIAAKKLGMTQIFDETGEVVPVTVLAAGPCTVIGHRTEEKDGYTALRLGYQEVDDKKLNKPEAGVFKKVGVAAHKIIYEARVEPDELVPIGQVLGVEVFKQGDVIDVTGTSKGKGFAGFVKRHGFHRGPETHGSMNVRQPGSIGATNAERVFKGTRMAGHMGVRRVTVKSLKVVKVDTQKGLVLVKGAVPGFRRSIVFLRKGK
jgi:large subunit ribosomal protein L3